MKIGAIIQARVSSNRLPEKILKKLPFDSDITVLEQVVRRVKASKKINEVIIATSTQEEDNKIIDLCESKNLPYFRGSLNNVLERFYKTAKHFDLDIIIRITSDCPCLDPELIDKVISFHLENNADYTTTTITRTFPHGLDFSIFNFKALKEAYENAQNDYEKEHVTVYFYKTKPENYRTQVYEANGIFNRPDIRVTLDMPEDYTLLCAVFDFLYKEDELFNLEKIINLFNSKPWLLNINSHIIQKKVFQNLKEEIKEGIFLCEKQDMKKLKIFLQEKLKNN